MKVTVLSYEPTSLSPLAPAPNVTEAGDIADILYTDKSPPVTEITATPLRVLTTHRGILLYCAGGVVIHRHDPRTLWVNGFSALPEGTLEDVIITCQGARFLATVRFDN
jgi:hypothetical protein